MGLYDVEWLDAELGAQTEQFERWAFGSVLTPEFGRDHAPKRHLEQVIMKWNIKHPERTVKDASDGQAVLQAWVDAWKKK